MILPKDVPFDQACCNFVNPMTAIALVDKVKQLKAKSVIVTAAASQLGQMMIRLL
jgi:NADPH:quinone reductase